MISVFCYLLCIVLLIAYWKSDDPDEPRPRR